MKPELALKQKFNVSCNHKKSQIILAYREWFLARLYSKNLLAFWTFPAQLQ